MSRLFFTLVLAAMLFPVINCGSSAHSPNEMYYLVATNIKLPYWQQAGAGLTKAATQMQVRAEMVGPDTYDANGEHEAFQRALSKKPSGIIVSVADPNVMKGDIDSAVSQGVPVITIDSDAPASARLMFVGTDNYNAGQMGGKIAAERLKGKGNVVIYTMPEQANLKERLNGYRAIFSNYPGIKVADTVDMKGDPRVAFDTTMDMLDKNAKIDGFICLEAIACPEIAEVLDRKKLSGKVVVAMDTDQRTLEGIQKGLISATIGQKPYTMAYMGVKLVDDLHHHPLSPLNKNWAQDSYSPIPTFVDTGAILVEKNNVQQFIEDRNTATKK